MGCSLELHERQLHSGKVRFPWALSPYPPACLFVSQSVSVLVTGRPGDLRCMPENILDPSPSIIQVLPLRPSHQELASM